MKTFIEKCKSVESLANVKKLGTEQEIIDNLNKIVKPLKVDVTSYEEILEVIKNLKEKHIDFIEGFFKSKQQEYIFYLTKLEGKKRKDLLNITEQFFEDKKLAKKWYKDISKLVHPDKNGDSDAFNNLTELYSDITEDLNND